MKVHISQEEAKEGEIDIEAPLETLEMEKAMTIGADIVKTEIMIEEESSDNLEEDILENQEMTEMVAETEIEEEVVKTAEIEMVEATKTAETETEEIEMRVKNLNHRRSPRRKRSPGELHPAGSRTSLIRYSTFITLLTMTT